MVNLIGGIVALVIWLFLTFVNPIAIGAVHLLLALGAVLVIRWWALKYAR